MGSFLKDTVGTSSPYSRVVTNGRDTYVWQFSKRLDDQAKWNLAVLETLKRTRNPVGSCAHQTLVSVEQGVVNHGLISLDDLLLLWHLLHILLLWHLLVGVGCGLHRLLSRHLLRLINMVRQQCATYNLRRLLLCPTERVLGNSLPAKWVLRPSGSWVGLA